MRQLPILNGKVYRSKYAAYQVLVRPRQDVWGGPDKTVLVDQIPPLTADFAQHGAEYKVEAPDGSEYTASSINGHFFDSAAAAEALGWSQAEHDAVVAALDRVCAQRPEEVWAHVLPKAEKPWPTYDDTHHKAIPGLAEQLGLVAEALAYEQENKARGEVVASLTEKLEAQNAEEELVAS